MRRCIILYNTVPPFQRKPPGLIIEKGLRNYYAFKGPLKIKLADNTILLAWGKGSSRIIVCNVIEKVNLVLNDVLYVPKPQNKLLSLPSKTEKGVIVQFKGKFCELIIDDKHYRIGHIYGK